MVELSFYYLKGLKFLKHTYSVLKKHGEDSEADTISRIDAPAFKETQTSLKSVIVILIIAVICNISMFRFPLTPELYLTLSYSIMSWVAAIINGYVIISLLAYFPLRTKVDFTCEQYNIFLQSFKYTKEYEDNNDNTG